MPIYLNWVPCRMSEDCIREYFEEHNGKISGMTHQKNWLGIKNGVIKILLDRETLDRNPIKSYVTICPTRIYVKYYGQIKTCGFCNEPGHLLRQCQKRKSRKNARRGNQKETMGQQNTHENKSVDIGKQSHVSLEQEIPTTTSQ